MEKHIQDAINDNIIKEAASKYGVPFKDVTHLGGFENFIYEYKLDDIEYVLRFVHSSHRSFEHVYAELEFIDYLANAGANVSTMIETIDNELVFKIDTVNEEYFSVSVFTKAPGTFVNKNEIDEEFIYGFGKAVGKLHALTKQYKPVHKRYHWHEEDYVGIGKRNLPKDKMYVVDKTIDHVKRLTQYSTDIDSYGLIHTDLHFGNMFYDGSVLTFFDWDDSSYKHFISDIAIIIFYAYGIGPLTDVEIEDKTIWFLRPFIKGYETENHLEKIWFEQLNEFFKLRELILVMVIYAAGEEMVNSGFGKAFLGKYEKRILNDVPFFNIERVLKELWSL